MQMGIVYVVREPLKLVQLPVFAKIIQSIQVIAFQNVQLIFRRIAHVELQLGLFVTQIPIVVTVHPPQDNAQIIVLPTSKVIAFVDRPQKIYAVYKLSVKTLAMPLDNV